MKTINWRLLNLFLVGVCFLPAALRVHPSLRAAAATGQGGGPSSSQPLALTQDNSRLIVANPDNNTVSIFVVENDQNYKMAEVEVGKEPNGVAFSSDGTGAYVANTADGTVSVLKLNGSVWSVAGTIPVGTEPYGIVMSQSGQKLYVSNARSNTVSVIDTGSNTVTSTISGVGPEPRGMAVTAGASDGDQTLYVTNFLALPANSTALDGSDNAKVGYVTAISVAYDTVIGQVTLNPVADSGFKAAGDALKHVAPPATPVATDFTFTTGAYPNQLNAIAVHNNFAYVPNTAASPNGPVRFNVNVQSLVNVIDLTSNQDAGQTINIQQAVAAQSNPQKLFFTNPWAIAFKHNADEGFVVSAASDVVAKLSVDPNSGAPTVQMNPADSSKVLEVHVGQNPRGIVISSDDSRAYVMNYISRDVSVIDLTQAPEVEIARMESANLPEPGTLDEKVQIGKALFNTSVGEFDPAGPGQPAITGRMSNNGWGACASCHPFGLSDNVVWIFASGPRRTVPLHATFASGDPNTQRALNWSAIFDQVADFEGNIRNVSGGLGIFVANDGITPSALPAAFTDLSGIPQLTVHGVGGWDAIKAYIQSGIRAPISPASKTDPDVVAGSLIFQQANCGSCHGSSQFTSSRVTFKAPPPSGTIVNTEIAAQLMKVGTFDPTAANEVRATAAAPLGADGFNPPPLLSLFAFPQTFFHNGSATSLDQVLQNVTHRSAGTSGADTLTDANARAQLIKFLLSIDASTPPPVNPY
ncbi:MAG TPA: beta-propeller fold lactonase family protein [Bryobacteraceae bacterium]|nr:beta-propeller fold lactonase family protein [Bryobacteraceae bacterium]